jgi:hypothetical protein
MTGRMRSRLLPCLSGIISVTTAYEGHALKHPGSSLSDLRP